MTKLIALLLVALVLEALGVVLLSAGLKEIGEVQGFNMAELGRIVRRGLGNPKLLLGIALEGVFFVLLLVLLKENDVSLIWPLTSLGFVLTALSARFLLHEQVTPTRWIGVLLIVTGAALVSWSEKTKPSLADSVANTSTAKPRPE
jgi:drug/metabolite transporter (DMT)-like permease